MSRGRPTRLLSGLLLVSAGALLTLWPRPGAASFGVSNLGSRLCQANPFTVWANETGRGSAGALMVWLLATRELLPHCDVHIIAPEGAGLVMHFLSASLRRVQPRRLRQRLSAHSAAGCVDTVSVVHATSDEAAFESNETTEETGGTRMVEPTCTAAALTNRHLVSAHEPAHAMTRIRLTVGDRDERSIVGYTLRFNVYLHGNWTKCPYANQFQCKDDNCIWNKLICDGLLNCLDRSDEYEATYAVCRHPLNTGLKILCFFGAVGAIVITLLTLDALGRYVLHSREVRSKQTRRPRARPSPVLFVDEEQPAATMRAADGGPINPLDRDLALFEKRAAADGKRKGKTVEGSKQPAPIEEAPRLGSPSKTAPTQRGSPKAGRSPDHPKSPASTRSPAVSSRPSSSRQDASDAKLSSLSYDLDFDVDSSKLRVPDVTPESSMLVEDDRHFPSDKPVKTSEAFMRLLELTMGKKSVPEHRGVLLAMMPLRHSSTPTSTRTVSLEPISSSATSPVPSTPVSSPGRKHSSPRREASSPSMMSSPSATSSSQPVRPRRSASKSRSQNAGSGPSSDSASEEGRMRDQKAKTVSPSRSKDDKTRQRAPVPPRMASEKGSKAQSDESKRKRPP